jgi:hypothetical protein
MVVVSTMKFDGATSQATGGMDLYGYTHDSEWRAPDVHHGRRLALDGTFGDQLALLKSGVDPRFHSN